MKKFIVSTLAAVACLTLTSCGHNGLFIAKGKVFSLNEAGFTYVNGTSVWDMSRENSSMVADFSDADGFATAPSDNQAKGQIRVSRAIGRQITGYLRDLAKVCPEAALEYLKSQPESVMVTQEALQPLEAEGKTSAVEAPEATEE